MRTVLLYVFIHLCKASARCVQMCWRAVIFGLGIHISHTCFVSRRARQNLRLHLIFFVARDKPTPSPRCTGAGAGEAQHHASGGGGKRQPALPGSARVPAGAGCCMGSQAGLPLSCWRRSLGEKRSLCSPSPAGVRCEEGRRLWAADPGNPLRLSKETHVGFALLKNSKSRRFVYFPITFLFPQTNIILTGCFMSAWGRKKSEQRQYFTPRLAGSC